MLIPFQKWDVRQRSIAGFQWNAQQQQVQYMQDQVLVKSKANINMLMTECSRIDVIIDLRNQTALGIQK